MNKHGFRLLSLTLTGSAVPSAEVLFYKGLNVISGPSDTGKTFVVQCIDYLLGSSKLPKSVPEAVNYESAELRILDLLSEQEISICRSLKSVGKLKVTKGNVVSLLAAKHKAGDENTISNFLLKLSGFYDRRVRVNKDGKVRDLSFRDIAKLIIIDEESIIKTGSPALTGQVISATAESSVFRLLLTGVDASVVDGVDENKVSPLKQAAKVEVLEQLLTENSKKIESLSLPVKDWLDVLQENERIDLIYQDAEESLEAHKVSSSELEIQRRDVLTQLYKVESKTDVLFGLKERFELLQQQYMADYARLQSIAEVNYRIEQLGDQDCPVCGAVGADQKHEHSRIETSHEEIAVSCSAEMLKIGSLLSDLAETRMDNEAQVLDSQAKLETLREDLRGIGNVLDGLVKPKIEAALRSFMLVQSERDLYRRAEELFVRGAELQDMLLAIADSDKKPVEGMTSPRMGAGEVSKFLHDVEILLGEWNFPNIGRVGFSEKVQDIVIADRSRASHGKGVRAITHAAFSLSLLTYCVNNKLPHPGLVIIDSPLVVYREPDSDEVGFSHEVKDSFYRSLAENFKEQQVIIVENDDPPEDVARFASLIKFTASKNGREGFIPI